jgi:hypothetical protein
MFLNIFISLNDSSRDEKNSIIKQLCMKQMSRLCTKKFDYLVYPHLSKDLVTITFKNEHFSSEKSREKMLYSKAFCIYELIKYRPDYYVQELLASISNLLNYCDRKNDGGICAILIDTLGVLCETEVVDMVEKSFG